MNMVSGLEDVQNKIINIRSQQVILDADVAELYGVETRDINKAVKNNPEKFPQNYIIVLSKKEKDELVENFHRFNSLNKMLAQSRFFRGGSSRPSASSRDFL
jgi:hypothetical protein